MKQNYLVAIARYVQLQLEDDTTLNDLMSNPLLLNKYVH